MKERESEIRSEKTARGEKTRSRTATRESSGRHRHNSIDAEEEGRESIKTGKGGARKLKCQKKRERENKTGNRSTTHKHDKNLQEETNQGGRVGAFLCSSRIVSGRERAHRKLEVAATIVS